MDLLNAIIDPSRYEFWLLAISALCLVLERIRPWRKAQQWIRKDIHQDVFFLLFNALFFGKLLGYVSGPVSSWVDGAAIAVGLGKPGQAQLLHGSPFWLQLAVAIVFKDFIEWWIHRSLHRFGWMWQFHKLHHSIEELDWIGVSRFHWMETVIYGAVTYLPMAPLGIGGRAALAAGIVSTLIGQLNHSNLRISWGPLRYVINSPRMHVWHHDYVLHMKYGQNYGIVLSVWDWLFGTAYMPNDVDQPERLGFAGMERFPTHLAARLIYPFWSGRRGVAGGRSST